MNQSASGPFGQRFSPLTTVGMMLADPLLRQRVEAVLERTQARVIWAHSEEVGWFALNDLMRQSAPDLFLVELRLLPEPVRECLVRLRANSPRSHVVAVFGEMAPAGLMEAIESGADDCLMPPLDTNFERLLERHNRRNIARSRRGKVTAFLSATGGCGATTIACHLATALGRVSGQNVLLADFDTEAGLVGFMTRSASDRSVLDAVDNLSNLDLAYLKSLVSTPFPGVEVLPVPPLSAFRGQRDPEAFRAVFRAIRAGYGWVMADLGRGLSPLSLTLLQDVEELFLVTTGEVAQLYFAKLLLRYLPDHGFDHLKIHLLINRRTKQRHSRTEDLEGILEHPILADLPEDEAVDAAFTLGRVLSPSSPLGVHLEGLARSLARLDGSVEVMRRARPVLGKLADLLSARPGKGAEAVEQSRDKS